MSTSRTREKADGELFKSTGIDDNATSTAVTIDASENVGVGATSLSNHTNFGHITAGGSSGGMVTNQVNGTDGMRLYSTAAGTILNETRNLPLDFSTNNTARMRIDSAGHAIIGGGVTLGNGQSYAAANTLDDYEEGTWTPTAAMLGSSWTAHSARYTKTGNLVHVQLYIDNIASNGTSSNAVIGGLPFSLLSNAWAVGSMNSADANADKSNFHVRMIHSSTNVELKHGRDTTLIASDIDASHIIFSLTYFTS